MTHTDKRTSIYPHHKIDDHSWDGVVWRRGYVVTRQGIVLVDTNVYNSRHSTRLEMAHNEVWHIRNFNDTYSDRYLVTLAKRFAQEVHNGA